LWLLYRAAFVGAGSAFVTVAGDTVTRATYTDYLAGTAVYSPARTIGVWVAAFLTLCTFSFLYRDNPFYKLAEATFVGVSAAYWMVVGFWNVIIPNLLGKLWPAWVQSWAMPGMSPVRDEHWWLYLIPLVLGTMLLWRLSPRAAWIGRWPLAFIIGSMAGIRLIGAMQSEVLGQIRNTIKPIVVVEQEVFKFWPSVQNILMLICVASALVYFFFSIEHKGIVGRISQFGVWVLMVTFGASFGYTVMGRIALLAARFEFLFDEWLWLIDPNNTRAGM
jgi:hypothetical protein